MARKHYKRALQDRTKALREEAWEKRSEAARLNDSAAFWEVIKTPFLNPVGGPSIEIAITEGQWTEHFSKIYNGTNTTMGQDTEYQGPINQPVNLNFRIDEVSRALSASTGGKATGPDGILVDLYKSNATLWVPVITQIINASCKVEFPPTCVESTIVPIFKKGDRQDPSCYRPISLLDSVAKVVGRIILECIQLWAEENNILSDLQYGFREGVGTVEQSLNLAIFMGKYTRAKKGNLYLSFVDLSAAFDCVRHSKLWEVMLSLGVDGEIINFIRQLYNGAKARVRFGLGGERTAAFPIGRGVRQGCVLAPFLLNLYINGLGQALLKETDVFPQIGNRPIPALLYADDA